MYTVHTERCGIHEHRILSGQENWLKETYMFFKGFNLKSPNVSIFIFLRNTDHI